MRCKKIQLMLDERMLSRNVVPVIFLDGVLIDLLTGQLMLLIYWKPINKNKWSF